MCDVCGLPWLVRYPDRVPTLVDRAELRRRHGHVAVPSVPAAPAGRGARSLSARATRRSCGRRAPGRGSGSRHLWIKDEGANPTGSFKARGLSAAITRAVAAGADRFVLPTAGNAGVAAAAYGARAGVAGQGLCARARRPAPSWPRCASSAPTSCCWTGTSATAGTRPAAYAAETGAVDLSTLREPYRIEGKKTLGLELALQLGWTLPAAIIYPTGGGTGLIGMWKAFHELRDAGWVQGELPRMYTVQSTGCAPVVRAFESGAEQCEPWPDPWTVASGLRVPGPLGGRLMLRILRETGRRGCRGRRCRSGA